MKEFLSKFIDALNGRAKSIGYPYVVYAIFQLISNPLFYLIWIYVDRQGYENFYIRLAISVLCVPLALKKYWPVKLKSFFALYWYLVVLYSLPFFFTFMLLKNGMTFGWALNSLTGVVLCILLIDTLSLLVLMPIGIAIGYLAYYLTTPYMHIAADYRTIVITYASVIIFGALFAHKREKIQQEKAKSMQLLGATIAHELRTPLLAVSAGCNGIYKRLPKLIDGYKQAQNAELPVQFLAKSEVASLNEVLNAIDNEVRGTFILIDMLLALAKSTEIKPESLSVISLVSCVEKALKRYPFQDGEREKIHWDNANDFEFLGESSFTVHILFNLIKNALYFIRVARKGEIYIWLERGDKYNRLHFKDTGAGIPKAIVKKVFQPFLTTRDTGTGAGLAFCQRVMDGFGGKIGCHSQEGKYAEFVLSFPVDRT